MGPPGREGLRPGLPPRSREQALPPPLPPSSHRPLPAPEGPLPVGTPVSSPVTSETPLLNPARSQAVEAGRNLPAQPTTRLRSSGSRRQRLRRTETQREPSPGAGRVSGVLLEQPGPGGQESRRTLTGFAVDLKSSAEHTPCALQRLVPRFPAQCWAVDPPVPPGGPLLPGEVGGGGASWNGPRCRLCPPGADAAIPPCRRIQPAHLFTR